MKKVKLLFWYSYIKTILFVIVISLSFTSCNKELDFTISSYKFPTKSTNVYSSPNGRIIGQYIAEKENSDYIQVKDSLVKDGWIPTTLKGFKGTSYLKVSDMKKKTITERYQHTPGRATLFTKKWWSNTLLYIELPTLGIWVMWITLALGILLIINNITDYSYHITIPLLLCLNVCEYLYFMTYEGDRTWFCDFNNNFLLSTISVIIVSIIIIFQIKTIEELFLEDLYNNPPLSPTLATIPTVALFTLASWWMGQVENLPSATAFIEKTFWFVMGGITFLYAVYSDGLKNKIYSAIIYSTTFAAIFLVLSYNLPSIVYIIVLYKVITRLPQIIRGVIKSFGSSGYTVEGEEVEVYVIGWGHIKGVIGRDGKFYGGGIEAYNIGGHWVVPEVGEGIDEARKRFNKENLPGGHE